MSVLLTGARGFIGQEVLAEFHKRGIPVIAASRRSDLPEPSVSFDCMDSSTWPRLLTRGLPPRLLHLAWDGLDCFEDPRHLQERLPAHLAFVSWCVKHGVRDVTVAGSCLEYGLQNGELEETAPAQPVIAYAVAKDCLRRSLECLAPLLGFTLKWARIFFVRGDGKQEKGVFRAIRNAGEAGQVSIDLSGCEQLRDFLGRREIGDFLVRFSLQDEVRGVVNCCSGRPVALRGLIESYAAQWPGLKLNFGRLPYRDYEPMALWGNRNKMDRVLKRGET